MTRAQGACGEDDRRRWEDDKTFPALRKLAQAISLFLQTRPYTLSLAHLVTSGKGNNKILASLSRFSVEGRQLRHSFGLDEDVVLTEDIYPVIFWSWTSR